MKSLHVLAIGWLFLAACGDGAEYERMANRTRAMSAQKAYVTAQSLYHVEYGRYASLAELRELPGFADFFSAGFTAALVDQPEPKPSSGYLFSEIILDETGGSLDFERRIGLAAHPSEPGVTGDQTILMLIDLELMGGVDEFNPVSHGEEWNYYVADARKVEAPPTRWPSPAELETFWKNLRKRTPAQGLREAEQIKRSLGDNR